MIHRHGGAGLIWVRVLTNSGKENNFPKYGRKKVVETPIKTARSQYSISTLTKITPSGCSKPRNRHHDHARSVPSRRRPTKLLPTPSVNQPPDKSNRLNNRLNMYNTSVISEAKGRFRGTTQVKDPSRKTLERQPPFAKPKPTASVAAVLHSCLTATGVSPARSAAASTSSDGGTSQGAPPTPRGIHWPAG